MSTPGKELLTNISQLASKEYLRRALGHHVQQRILIDEINAHLAGRRLLAASSGLDNARAAPNLTLVAMLGKTLKFH